MINLLPEKNIKKIRLDKNWKKMFIILSFFLIALIFLSGILNILNIYTEKQAYLIKGDLIEKEKSVNNEEFQRFQTQTNKINRNLSKIKNYLESKLFSAALFEDINNIIPEGIYFTNISYQKKKEKDNCYANVFMSGLAVRRDDLYEFKKLLEGQDSFNGVEFLASSWVKSDNVEFSLTFIYDDKK